MERSRNIFFLFSSDFYLLNNSDVSTISVRAYEVLLDVDAKFCSADIRCRVLYYHEALENAVYRRSTSFVSSYFPLFLRSLLDERRFPVTFCTRNAKEKQYDAFLTPLLQQQMLKVMS